MSSGIRFFCSLIVFCLIPFVLPAESPEEENLNRVIAVLNKSSIPFEKRSLLTNYGGFGSSLLVRSRAERDNSLGTFVFAVPLDAYFAVDTALALSEIIQKQNNPVHGNSPNILVAFLGDEKNELPVDQGGIAHKGLRDLLTLTDMPENWILCYLDVDKAPEELVIRHGIRGYLAPLDIVKPLAFLLRSRDIPYSFRIRYNVIYKLGLVEGPEPLFISWKDEIHSFVLSGNSGNEKQEKELSSKETISPDNLAGLFLDYAGSLNFPVMNPDMHFFTFSFPGRNVFFVSEGLSAVLLLVTTGIFLFFFLLYSARFNAILHFNIKLFFKHIWVFFILLPFLTVSIKASGLLYSLFLRIFGPQVPAMNANYTGAGLTILLAALIFYLPSPVLDFFRFPRREQFYGSYAVIFIITGMFMAAYLDFSYVPIFLWAVLFVFLGASVSRPILVCICILLVPLFVILALLNIFETGYPRIAELFISPGWNELENWMAAFQTAQLSLPLFLLVNRGSALARNSKPKDLARRPNRQYRLILFPILIAAILGTMVLQILLLPRNQVLPERRFITEGSDTEGGKNIIKLSLENVVFQDSRIITLRLASRGNPVRFDISLESGTGVSLLPVYSAQVPFEREDEGRRITFSLGEHAPNPLTMEIVVPQNFEGLLKTEAVYNTWDPVTDPGEKPDSADYVLRVSRSIELGQNRITVFTSGIQH